MRQDHLPLKGCSVVRHRSYQPEMLSHNWQSLKHLPLSTALQSKPTQPCTVGGNMNWCNVFAGQSSNLCQNLTGTRLWWSRSKVLLCLRCLQKQRRPCIAAALTGLFIIAGPEGVRRGQQDIRADCGAPTQWFLLGCQRNRLHLYLSVAGTCFVEEEKKHLHI